MQELDFITTEEYTKEDIKKVQKRLLKMAKVVATILETNKVPYMIVCGTLLGAIRHSGFIPWDDDFDFCLFDDNYEKAIEILRRELPKNLFLEDEKSEPLYFHGWAHVKDLKTVAACDLFPQDDLYSHRGISLDLYITKRMKRKDLEQYLNDENEQYIERRYKKGLMSIDEYKKRKEKLNCDIEKAKENKNVDNKEIFGYVSMYENRHFEVDEVLPLKKYKFEDCYFYGPNKGEKILERVYGNYNEFPEINKRKSHYTSVSFT